MEDAHICQSAYLQQARHYVTDVYSPIARSKQASHLFYFSTDIVLMCTRRFLHGLDVAPLPQQRPVCTVVWPRRPAAVLVIAAAPPHDQAALSHNKKNQSVCDRYGESL